MSGNPLENDPARDDRIRERAYHLWDREGRPHGQHDEFWERARELVGMEESAGTGQLPNPQSSGRDPLQEQPVEEAFLQENLGEFPSRFTDQGETQPTPMVKSRPSSPEADAPAARATATKALASQPRASKSPAATPPVPKTKDVKVKPKRKG